MKYKTIKEEENSSLTQACVCVHMHARNGSVSKLSVSSVIKISKTFNLFEISAFLKKCLRGSLGRLPTRSSGRLGSLLKKSTCKLFYLTVSHFNSSVFSDILEDIDN